MIFLFGMAGAGLADVINVRLMIVVRVGPVVRRRPAFALVAPGLGIRIAACGAGAARAPAVRRLPATPFRPATLADFDLLVGKLPTFARLSEAQRRAFVKDADVREVPAGTRIVEHGDTASAAYFILDGAATAGIPQEGGYRGLSTMRPGDFFGEIAALTGSPRTADVVADSDTTLLEVPAEACARRWPCPEIQQPRLLDADLAADADGSRRPAASRRRATRRRCATCARHVRASRRCRGPTRASRHPDRCLTSRQRLGQAAFSWFTHEGVQSGSGHIRPSQTRKERFDDKKIKLPKDSLVEPEEGQQGPEGFIDDG